MRKKMNKQRVPGLCTQKQGTFAGKTHEFNAALYNIVLSINSELTLIFLYRIAIVYHFMVHFTSNDLINRLKNK